MRKTWPTPEELDTLQAEENKRADEQYDYADVICDCGNPGYACCCERIAHECGYWSDGTLHDPDGYGDNS